MRNDQPPTPVAQPQPVAYDAQGRPLYHHPAEAPAPVSPPPARDSLVSSRPASYEGHNFDPRLRTQYANEPDLVHAPRPVEPQVAQISPELRQKHETSVQRHPQLNLSEGEFVVLQIYRHPIGMLIPVASTAIGLMFLSVIIFMLPEFYPATPASAQAGTGLPGVAVIVGILALLMLIVAIFGSISVWVYIRNRFFLTNESVIQEIQHSLFSRHEQTVSLGSIEDASYRQQGILQHIFNYGSMRLSTEGEETTYRFAFVEDPKKQVAIVNNAVEAFKNGRPVE